ncbi:hypothetical protein [Microbacterium oxydans]|uniref:Uncharacterized protein n=1 Tax=Microbacterium oxydans TaxID=82380 RepID=A0A0F0LCV4_9MICO|nr:hypothetical protein [Microbacterium oxydans]KJL30105.1 hypothetical protein RS83_01247 [Microbacterium oxydans]
MSFGQRELEGMIARGELEECPPDAAGADKLIAKARVHHATAAAVVGTDPETAADALHAGNRKALEAVLLARGLRPTKSGGHIAARDGVKVTIGGGRTLRVYDVVRRVRHEGDYLSADSDVDPEDVTANLGDSEALVDSCAAAKDAVPVFVRGRR